MMVVVGKSKYLLRAVSQDRMDLWPSILNTTTTVSSHFACLHYSFMLILIDEDTLKNKGRKEEGERNTFTVWSLIPVNLQFILQEYYSKEMSTFTFWEGFFFLPVFLLFERLKVGCKQALPIHI